MTLSKRNISFRDTLMLLRRTEWDFSFYRNSVSYSCQRHLIPHSCKERTYMVHGYSIIFCQNHWHGVHKAGKLEFIWMLTVHMVTQDLSGSLVFLILEGPRRYPANAFQPLKISLVQILKFQATNHKCKHTSTKRQESMFSYMIQTCLQYLTFDFLDDFRNSMKYSDQKHILQSERNVWRTISYLEHSTVDSFFAD